jgi:ATP-dependent Lon protease
MNVFQIEAPDLAAARQIARQIYQGLRDEHDWGRLCEATPRDNVLDALAGVAPREMRRALMTGFGNARLERRDHITPEDLPRATGSKSRIGFLQ